MPKLTVNGFSSIRRARITTAPLTLLVGPQASGKSLISKLLYFFNDLARYQVTVARDGETLRAFREQISSQFKDWFPVSAWGKQNFQITYTAGEIVYSIERKKTGQKEPSNDIEVKFSKFVSDNYNALLRRFRQLARETGQEEEDLISISPRPGWEIERQFLRGLRERLGHEFIDNQFFVPAGRSFFTTLGKAFAILEHGGRVDTILSRFGSLYAYLVDEGAKYYVPDDRASRDTAKIKNEKRRQTMIELFGGQLRIGANKQFLETSDGRRIPFSLMSSGQQELLPLWVTLNHFSRVRDFSPSAGKYQLFIEEPEAHLFPTTQSFLIQYIATLVSESNYQNQMFLTTHSPYVLSKINNLIKAGSVGAERSRQVAKVVPKSAWLSGGSVRAFAICDGDTRDIVDDDGLIDGDYLDEISNDISEEFLELLRIEVGE